MVFVEKNHNKFLIFSVLVAVLSTGIVSSFVAYADDDEVRTLVCNAGQVMIGIMGYGDDDDEGITIVCKADPFASANMIPLHFEQKGIITIPSDSSFSNLKKLAMWEVEKDPNVEDNYIIASLEGMTGHLKKTEGTAFNAKVIFGFFTSSDGINWDSKETISAKGDSFSPQISSGVIERIEEDTRFFAFAVHGEEGAAGELKDVSGTVLLTLPVGYAIQQELPVKLPPIGDDDYCDDDDDDGDDDECDDDDDDDDD